GFQEDHEGVEGPGEGPSCILQRRLVSCSANCAINFMIPVRGPPATGRYRRNRRLPVRGQGDASSSNEGTRRCLVFQRENEVPPRLLGWGTRRHLVFPPGNEAPSHLPVGERGDASSPCAGTRRRLILPRGQATP
ncbi:hypothetical protein GW17_00056600, partial [Ensete ventricosum]